MTRPLLVVGICTFRRPALAETLASVAAQRPPPGWRLEILVADNDDVPSARDLVEAFATGSDFPVAHVHAPARNISVARNAILAGARARGADRLAFIDDDETASEGWLRALVDAMDASGADAVMGPVIAKYQPAAPNWMRALRPHDTLPETDTGGRPIAGHTCNALVDLASPALADRWFDPLRGRSGGEDTAFFAAVRRAGGRMALAPEAIVREAVPQERAHLRWLATRRYRMGQTHGSLLPIVGLRHGRAARAMVAAAKVAWCAGAAVATAPGAAARNRAVLRGALHLGTLSALLGARAVVPYGNEDPGESAPSTERKDA